MELLQISLQINRLPELNPLFHTLKKQKEKNSCWLQKTEFPVQQLLNSVSLENIILKNKQTNKTFLGFLLLRVRKKCQFPKMS